MKPVIVNDTTFRLYDMTLGGFGKNGLERVFNGAFRFEIPLMNWLEEHTPGYILNMERSEIDDRTTHFEVLLTFKRPEDAVSFKLRWL